MPESHMPGSALITLAALHPQRTAIVDCDGEHSYGSLLDKSARVATALLGTGDLQSRCVPFLITPGFPWVAVQWGIWRAGGIAVPLPLGSPAAELQYFIRDTQAAVLIADAPGAELVAPSADAFGLRLLLIDELLNSSACASQAQSFLKVPENQPAMVLYTSGTTGRPKGVVMTHANIAAQVTTLVGAWQWSEADRILLCLPLHHVHGIINVLSCALWSGAVCEMLPRFEVESVWERIASGRLTLFMAVPTVYAKLISAWEAAPQERRAMLSEACRKLRLMVSGSAALPVSTLNRWREISGHTLLERYGMTEIGMALSNPLEGPRVPGSVGMPLPGVNVRLVDERGAPVESGAPGEIEVRGPGVFKEYWGKPQATREAFRDGWFRTGDLAVVEEGRYRLLGRMSTDIIKTGGHKVSALEIEEMLREHPAIAECAVVGIPDPEWGERVAAAVVLRPSTPKTAVLGTPGVSPGAELDLGGLRSWAKERLAAYKAPSLLKIVDTLPRNAMGKVQKPAVAELFKPLTEQR